MNRGMVYFSQEEENYLKLLLGENDSTSEIYQRLNLPPTNNPGIQISEEDAEKILDLLPPPQQNQDQFIKSCRSKLNDFLNHSKIATNHN